MAPTDAESIIAQEHRIELRRDADVQRRIRVAACCSAVAAGLAGWRLRHRSRSSR